LSESPYLLEIEDLHTWFHTHDGVVKAVDGVDLRVRRGEVVGLVGESGCGKSVTSFSILQLVPYPGRIGAGKILFKGRDILQMSREEITDLRGDEIAMIFQQPTSALNPVYRVGLQIGEMFELHRDMARKAGEARAAEMLAKVGIPDPGRRALAFPHELSGGMAQRVMIAMALACEPDLLIADEPTTALDVTIQAQILDLIRELRGQVEMAVILITHNLGIVAEMAERVAVMYAGQIVEEAPTQVLFSDPKHPYTQGLLGSVPVMGARKATLDTIPGRVPSLIDLPPGCRFAPRCEARVEADCLICSEEEPALLEVEEGHKVRCWLYAPDRAERESMLEAHDPEPVEEEAG
jgi:oligopeptide/dipeptide ABC transporter ATP-binding protein